MTIKKIMLLLFVAIKIYSASAQNKFMAIITDSETKEAINGATIAVLKTNISGISNQNGIIELLNIPNGTQTIKIDLIGYEPKTQIFDFPLATNDTIKITLKSENEELEEVVVQSTRTSRTIANTPTRIETIDTEELDEKSNMRPANVSMVLHESTGLQVQQTSATSGNASIRVQGLDGRYTQLLKDSYPNFGKVAKI